MRLPNAHLAVVEQKRSLNICSTLDTVTAEAKRGSFSRLDLKSMIGQSSPKPYVGTASVMRFLVSDKRVGAPRYEIDGELNTPDGREPRIRTVWQFDKGQIAPRLITALSFGGRE